jgi:hypothetical protein
MGFLRPSPSFSPLLIFIRSLVTCSVLPSRSRNRIGEALSSHFRHTGRVLHVGPTGFLPRLSLPTELESNPSIRSQPRRSLPCGTLAPAEPERPLPTSPEKLPTARPPAGFDPTSPPFPTAVGHTSASPSMPDVHPPPQAMPEAPPPPRVMPDVHPPPRATLDAHPPP